MNRFRVWAGIVTLAAGSLTAVAAGKGDAAKGKATFETCAVCHNVDSTVSKVGPGLKGLFKKDKLANGKKATEANIREKLEQGGNGMPAYKDALTDSEKDDVMAYLKTL